MCTLDISFHTKEPSGDMFVIYPESVMDDFIQLEHSSSINLMCNTVTDMTRVGCLQGGGPVDIVLKMTVYGCPCDCLRGVVWSTGSARDSSEEIRCSSL